MQIYYEFFISATISSPNMTRDSNELKKIVVNGTFKVSRVLFCFGHKVTVSFMLMVVADL